MPQSRTYTPLSGTFVVTGVPYGTGQLNSGNLNGLQATSGVPTISIVTGSDGLIPSGSTITNVTTKWTLGRSSNALALGFFETDSTGTFIQANVPSGTLAKFPQFSIMTNNWGTSSPDGTTFTTTNVFTTKFYVTISGGTVDDYLDWSAFQLIISFTLPVPVPDTLDPVNVTRTHVTFNGTVDPNGATAAYPVSYQFEYGKTITYGSSFPAAYTGTLTGTQILSVIALSPNTLTPNSVYHYRLKVKTADGIFNGDDVLFITPLVDTPFMRF